MKKLRELIASVDSAESEILKAFGLLEEYDSSEKKYKTIIMDPRDFHSIKYFTEKALEEIRNIKKIFD